MFKELISRNWRSRECYPTANYIGALKFSKTITPAGYVRFVDDDIRLGTNRLHVEADPTLLTAKEINFNGQPESRYDCRDPQRLNLLSEPNYYAIRARTREYDGWI